MSDADPSNATANAGDAPAGWAAGHFGEWLQGRLGADGPVVLVTLACDHVGAQVRRRPADGLHLDDALSARLSIAQATTFLVALHAQPRGMYELLETDPPGRGTGMSTAALVALARAAGSNASPVALAAACLAVEGATDPLMLPQPDAVLWESRRARSAATLPRPPRFDVVGGFYGDPSFTDPRDENFPDVRDLVQGWRDATVRGDRNELAAIAGLSAERCTAGRGPIGDPTSRLAKDLGALGHARAHTGSARALLFAPGEAPADAEAALTDSGLTHVTLFSTGAAS